MSVTVMHNPALAADAAAVEQAALEAGLDDHILFQTSGSSARAKWVALSNEALDVSADAVNAHLQANPMDVWLRALPTFHVGGYAIERRAQRNGARVLALDGAWQPEAFHEAALEATLSALVPTQIFDLVAAGLSAPANLRAVLVGGGALRPELRQQAEALGWPLLETYGMTEAGSQIATERDGALEVLPCWEPRCDPKGELSIRGAALFSGYLIEEEGIWQWQQPFDADGWFGTGDRVELDGRQLRFSARANAEVKVLGERVDLDGLQSLIESIGGQSVAIAAVADSRAGCRLVLAHESHVDAAAISEAFDAQVSGFERISAQIAVPRIPRSSLGKLQRGALDQILENTSAA